MEKYGKKNPGQVKEFKDKMKETNLEKRGVEYALSSPEVIQKRVDNLIETYGVDNIAKLESTKEKTKQVFLDKYGYKSPTLVPEIRQKQIDKTLENHGVKSILSKKEVREKGALIQLEKYGSKHFLSSKKFDNHREEYNKKGIETCLKKYGKISAMQVPEILDKQHQTKRKNNSFKGSKEEDRVFEELEIIFGRGKVKKQYKSEKYPFLCDFFIEEENLYIELQGNWTHGGKSFNPYSKEDLKRVDEMREKSKTSKYYKIALEVWTVADPKKRLIAKENGIKLLELFSTKNIKEQIERIEGLSISYTQEEMNKEFDNFKNKKGSYESAPIKNKIVLNYHKHFFEHEKEIYTKDPIKRRRLIENRVEHLHKKEEDLSDYELLTGFKKSGIYYGYSHFSPLWIKAFIEEFNVKSIYDPCGGWSQRLLGSLNLEKYIYNDLNRETYKATKKIVEDFKITNTTLYNKDAEVFSPKEDYEAVFTCPPFYNLEDYGINTSYSYDDWINVWWRKVIKNSLGSSKLFAFVINDKLLEDMKRACVEEGLDFIGQRNIGLSNKSHLNKNPHQLKLLIFKNTR